MPEDWLQGHETLCSGAIQLIFSHNIVEWDNPVAVNPQEPFANLSHPNDILSISCKIVDGSSRKNQIVLSKNSFCAVKLLMTMETKWLILHTLSQLLKVMVNA